MKAIYIAVIAPGAKHGRYGESKMQNSKIEWTDHTFNPWLGCTKVSPGCKHCYAETLMDKRYGRVQWGPQGERVRTSTAYWKKPLAWNRKAAAQGERHRVFCASLADVFEEKPDQPEMDEWRCELFELIEKTPSLDWLLLTKRPENVVSMVAYAADRHGNPFRGGLPANLWVGTSVESQETADTRIPELREIPARVRFLSVEPLLEAVDLSHHLNLHWVIVGGESGPNARPMNPAWARSIRDQCVGSGVPFFFKQWGRFAPRTHPVPEGTKICHFTADSRPSNALNSGFAMWDVGKKKAGRLLDGREWNQWPETKAEVRTPITDMWLTELATRADFDRQRAGALIS